MAPICKSYGINIDKLSNRQLIDLRKEVQGILQARRAKGSQLHAAKEKAMRDFVLEALKFEPVNKLDILKRGGFGYDPQKFDGKGIYFIVYPSLASVTIYTTTRSELCHKPILKVKRSKKDNPESFANKLTRGIEQAQNLVATGEILES